MSPATIREIETWLAKRLDAYQRYGHLVANQATAWVEDDLTRIRELDEVKDQLLSWLKLDEPTVDLDRAVVGHAALADLLQETRTELARVAELERAYQRALEGILVDTREALAELAENPRDDGGYGAATALTGSALDLTL